MSGLLPRAIVALLGLGASGSAYAQSVDVIPTIGAYSDLRDRGLSISDRDLAGTASITIDTPSGFYTGFSGAAYGSTPRGDSIRLTPFAGYAMPVAGYVLDLSVQLDSFDGGVGQDDWQAYPEVSAALSRDFGLLYVETKVTYAPDGRWFTPDNNSLYFRSGIEVPIPGASSATLIARYGYDVRDGLKNASDYEVGLSVFVSDLELTATYTDSTQQGRIAGSAVVFGARFFF